MSDPRDLNVEDVKWARDTMQRATERALTSQLEWRGESVWCREHNAWWKDCPCVDKNAIVLPITQAMVDATTPSTIALAEWLKRVMA